MPSNKQQEIPVSSFVSKLADAKKEGLTFLTHGYIASVDDKVVRMYLDLSLETFVEIPRSAVLHAQTVKDDMHERAELMVNGASSIQLVHQQTRTITPSELQQAIDEQKRQAAGADPRGMLSKLPAPAAVDPCAKPSVSSECGCGGGHKQEMGSPSVPSLDVDQAGRDPLRRAARWAMGPIGLLF